MQEKDRDEQTAGPADPPTGAATRVALLGLGEAGRAIAADLVSGGVEVTGWDPVVEGVEGVKVMVSAGEAAAGAQIVLSVNSAKAASAVASGLADQLGPDQVFADLNSASPALKEQLAAIIAPSGAGFVDVALMSPVPGLGIRTPALASGSGAKQFVSLMAPLGMPVEFVGAAPGTAAARKLLRSVFVKGMHAAFFEGYQAAEKLGLTEWYVHEVGGTLDELNASATDRILNGTRLHAARRTQEMQAAADLLRALQLEPHVTSAAIAILREIAARPRPE